MKKYKQHTVVVPSFRPIVVGVEYTNVGKVINKYGEDLVLVGYDVKGKPIYGINK